MEIGYALSSEEHTPRRLVDLAGRAEEAGMTFALISDHFHPWIERQGESGFVWGTLGAIAERTTQLVVGTGVTCPLIRMHPAVVAHAAATAASLMPGRFFLGVGTGENLNEHVLGDRWPPPGLRREMLAEAIEIIRALWSGDMTTHRGRHYTVENARLFTLPEEPPPIVVAAGGPDAATLAGTIGDGLVATRADRELIDAFLAATGPHPGSRYGQLTVCVAQTRQKAVETALEWWPNGGLLGPLAQELALPSAFEAASGMVSADDIAREVVCGPDPENVIDAIEQFRSAGFSHVYLHQVGPDQEALFDLFASEIAPWAAHAFSTA